jgi:hypothetical protein
MPALRHSLAALALSMFALSACLPPDTTVDVFPTPRAQAVDGTPAPSGGATAAAARSMPGAVTPPALGGPAAGSYAAALPAADAGVRLLTLVLAEDATATLTTVVLGQGTVLESGKWSQEGDSVTVTLTESDGVVAADPTTFEFALEDGNLVNKVWSQELYGEMGLGTLLRQP